MMRTPLNPLLSLRCALFGALLLARVALSAWADPIAIAEVKHEGPVDFEREVAPLLRRNCVSCHNRSRAESELVLESAETITRGGAQGSAIDVESPDESLLLQMAAHRIEPFMPPADNKVGATALSSEELGLLKLWIAEGAPGPAPGAAPLVQWQPLPESINAINAVVVSSDGRWAVCNRGARLHAYDLMNRRWAGALIDPAPELAAHGAAHHDVCQSLALAPDGELLASGGFREIKLWRAAAPPPETLLELGGAAVCAALSDDGQRLAVGGADALWMVDLPGRKIAARTSLRAAPRAIAWSADASRLALLTGEAEVEVRQAENLARVGGFTAPRAVGGVCFDLDGSTIATSDASGRLDHWSFDAPAPREMARDTEAFTLVRYAPDGCRAVAATSSGGLYLIDLTTGRPLRRWLGHTGQVLGVAWLDSGTRLASVSADGTLHTWADSQHAPVATVTLGADSIGALAMAGGRLWVGRATGGLTTLPVEGLSENSPRTDLPGAAAPAGQGGGVTPWIALLSSPDGATLFGVDARGNVISLDVASGQMKFKVLLQATIVDAAVSPDGAKLAICAASEGGPPTLRWFNAADGAAIAAPGGDSLPAERVAFLDAQRVLVAQPDGAAVLLDAASGAALESASPAAGRVRGLAAQGSELLMARGDGSLQRITLHWRSGVAAHPAAVTALARIGAARLLSGAADGSVQSWHGAPLQSKAWPALAGGVAALQPAPDGKSALALAGSLLSQWKEDQADWTPLGGDVEGRLALARQTALNQGAERRLAVADEARKLAETDTATAKTAETAARDALAAAEKKHAESAAQVAQQVSARDTAIAAATAATEAATRAAAAQQQAAAAVEQAAQQAKPIEDQLAAAGGAVDDAATTVARLASARDLTQQSPARTVPLVAELAAQLEASLTVARQAEAAARQGLEATRAAGAGRLDALTKARAELAAAEAGVAPTAAAAKAADEAKAAAEKVAAEGQKAAEQAAAAVTNSQQDLARKTHDREIAERQVAERTRETDELRRLAAEAAAQLKTLEESQRAAARPLASAAYAADGQTAAVVDDSGLARLVAPPRGASFRGPRLPSPPRFVALEGDQLLWLSSEGALLRSSLNPSWSRAARLGPPGDDPAALANSLLADRVTALAFTPDGARLASGGGEPSRSGELCLWDAATGELQWRLPEAHSDTILSLAFSPDGRWLAAGSADKFVKVFEADSGRLVRSFEGHTQHVLGLAWRADGLVLASAGGDQSVKLWNYDTGEQLRTITGYGKAVSAVQFVGGQPETISGSGDGVLRMHNADDGKSIRNFGGAATYLSTLGLSADGRILAAGGADSVLRIWSTAESKVESEFPPPAVKPE